MAKKKKNKTPRKAETPETQVAVKRPILRVTLRFLIICLIFTAVLYFIDSKGVFEPSKINNHIEKKWNSIHSFTKNNDVDILLVGNSHLYTGLNPKNLSTRLANNAFVIASPGTHIGDTYFALKEAINLSKPKLVVVETYGIKEFNPYQLDGADLSDQLKSFAARKNFWKKLNSTPFLFKPENYGYAWSNTLRNHDFLLNNYEQIEKNLSPRSRFSKKKNDKLYLGRYVRFSTGLEDSVLNLYENNGAPVDGSEYEWNEYTQKYVEKIVNLCNDENIELMFYTIPMYEKHVKNYDSWKKELSKLIKPTNKKWLDLQLAEEVTNFTPEHFENTYNDNQHLTYKGSLKATYKLADFVDQNFSLPSRADESSWHDLFYGEEGYFRHFPPKKKDKKSKLVNENVNLNGVTAADITYYKHEKNWVLQARFKKEELENLKDIKNYKVYLNLTFEFEGKVTKATLDLLYDEYHTNPDYYLFSRSVKPLKILDANTGQVAHKNKGPL